MQKHKENVFLTKSAARGYLFAANSALGAPPAVYKILRAARAVRGHVQQPATRRAGCHPPPAHQFIPAAILRRAPMRMQQISY